MDACNCIESALLAGTTFLSLAYIYGQWKNTFFHQYGIPGPHPEPYLGNIREIRKKGFREVLTEWMQSFGDVYGFYIGNTPTIFVKDLDILKDVSVKHFQDFPDRMFSDLNPGIIRHGVLFSKGDAWRRQRAVMAPTFSGVKLDKMGSTLNDCADALVKRLRDRAGEEIVLRDYFGQFTLEVIVKAAFGLNTDTDDILYDNLRQLIRPGKKGAFSHFSSNIFPSTVPLLRLLGFSVIPKDPYEYILQLLVDIIRLRKLQPKKENKDFMQLLIDAESTEIPNANEKTIKKLSGDEILGQMFMFIIAGYETTASTLNFLAHSLAVYPDIQRKVVDEIHQHLDQEEPTYHNVGELKYLENVVKEVLRMYPVIYGVNRHTVHTRTIKGVTFPRGSNVYIPIYHIHRDPAIYPDPDTFNPDRWSDNTVRHPMAYIPFGAGPRFCVGMKLAVFELKVAIIKVLRAVKFSTTKKTQEKITFADSSFLAPKAPIVLQVEKR
ncbi:cytochrome P450 3A8-like [Haliotis asinina]|uniref:cytochrome P450 3A8-like n=1 Tax=Haliotis asinina TaxID=109174 RepID=UPI003531AE3C